MVAKLSVPSEDSIDLIRRIIAERIQFRAFYDRIQPEILSRAELYREYHGNPKQLSPLNLTDFTDSQDEANRRKNSLIGLYSPKEDKLPYSRLEEMRKRNGLVVCPSCGEPGRPRTLDHYLPKAVFPEYSVLLLNLTPMCDWCQGEKLAEYLTDDGLKRYIHPYFDEVDRILFYISFNPPYASPTIDLVINNELPEDLYQLVDLHLEGISFLDRFKYYFRTRYRNILRHARTCRNSNNNLHAFLSQCLSMESDNSENSWDVVIYRSILNDDQIMNYLKHEELPDNL